VQGAGEDGGAARDAAVESDAARGTTEVRETSLGWNPGGTAGVVRGVTRGAKPGGITGARSPGGLPGRADKPPQ
jgi:hypothetical protein